jgi:SAM-dependent methyltransferase
MEFEKPTTDEQLQELGEGYHGELAKNWPAPRGQLHHGGWATTHILLDNLNISDDETHLLDICCGEGETASWIAQTLNKHVVGIDMARSAIDFAKRSSQQANSKTVDYILGDLFAMPFTDGQFDIVYGQDPDGLAHFARAHAFVEIHRVLKPGGKFHFHHWILEDDIPQDLSDTFYTYNRDIGYGSIQRTHLQDYLDDIKAAGFTVDGVEDWSHHYADHLKKIKEIRLGKGLEVDGFTNLLLEIIDQNYRVGFYIQGRKAT